MTTRASVLSLLGGFLFSVDGERRDVPARKVKALVCRLAVDDAPLPREQLSALLWPDSSPSAARHSLRQALTELRRGLHGSAIGLTVTSREAALETYGGRIDVREFRALAESGDEADWAAAMALYRGSLLEGLEVRVDVFEEWLDVVRRELAQTAARLCRALADHHEDDVERAIHWTRRLLALEPLDEPGYRDLMRLYILAGQDGAAIRQFLHCRSLLQRELGIAPEDETTALYESLLHHRSAGGRAPASPEHAAAGPEPPAGPAPSPRLRPAVVLVNGLSVDEADPERAESTRATQLEILNRVVRSYGGRVVAHVAGQVVSGFGLDRVRGTEVERTCLAAAELDATLPRLRSGVASGQVLFRPEEGSLVGQAVDEAQALAAAAAPGEVRMSETVAGARRAGGVAGAGAAAGNRGEAPLVGRAMELRQFVAVLDSSRDGGYGCAVLLRGEAGIGKSRLVREFVALALQEGFAVHLAQADDFGVSRGQDAIAQLVRSLLGSDGTDADAIGRRVSPRHVPYLQAILGLDPAPEAAEQLAGLSPLERLRRSIEAIADSLRVAVQDHAVLLVVDDLHWADRLSLAVLPRLARLAAELPVVLVMTSRVAGEALDPEWRAAMGGAPLVTLDLRPLREDEAGRLASDLGAGQQHLAELIERAGGNPLFIQQLVRSARLGHGLPHSIQSLAVAQLEALPENVQDAVRAASVLGQRFTLPALEALVAGHVELGPALEAGLLARGDGEWRFHHSLIREGIYQNVLQSERRMLHVRAAQFFRAASLTLHAEHLDLADAAEAVPALLAAAEDEIEHYRLSRARRLVERALERSPGHPLTLLVEAELELMAGNTVRAAEGFRACRRAAGAEEIEARALVGLGMALNQLDRYPEAVDAMREAVGLLVDDHDYQADAWLQLGNVLFPQGLTARCLQAHQASLDHAVRAGSTLRQARAEGGLGDAYYQQGAMITAYGHFDRSVIIGETHGHAAVVPPNLAMRGMTLLYQNRVAEALAGGERALALARKSSNLRHQLLAHNVLAGIETFHGGVEAGLAHARCALELGQRIGSRRFALDSRSQMAHLLWLSDRHGEAREVLSRAEQELDPDMLPFAGAYLRGLQAVCAGSADARRAFLAAGERCLDIDAVSHCHLYFRIAAMEACLAVGEHPEAVRHADALAAYTAAEPLPFSDFFIRRARTLAGEASSEALESLAEEARASGLGMGLRLLGTDPLERGPSSDR